MICGKERHCKRRIRKNQSPILYRLLWQRPLQQHPPAATRRPRRAAAARPSSPQPGVGQRCTTCAGAGHASQDGEGEDLRSALGDSLRKAERFWRGYTGNTLVTMPCFGIDALDSTRASARSAKPYRAALDTLLMQRNSNVNHRSGKVIDQDRQPGQEVDPIETGHTVHNQRRKATIGGSHAIR